MQGIKIESTGRPAGPGADLYDYEHRVEGAVKLLRECPLPYVVAVEGEWGRGKSTFLNLISAALEEVHDDELSIVAYRPWHYDLRTFEDAWESMVELVGSELETEEALHGKIDSLLAGLAENRWMRLASKLVFPVVAWTLPAATEVTAQLLEGAREHIEEPRFLRRRYTIFESVRAKLVEVSRERRIVLMIDDLDRCDPEAVSHVFRAIAVLFGGHPEGPNFVILMAIDRRATARALAISNGWDSEYIDRYLEKIINVHVTLPMLDIGGGDRDAAEARIFAAIRDGGNRCHRIVELPDHPSCYARWTLPEAYLRAIARFMHYNPRELERFSVLFDLKWDSRFRENARSFAAGSGKPVDPQAFQAWLDRFRDRLVWETILELRWPLYDAKRSDSRANKDLIRRALQNSANFDEIDSRLPAAEYLDDPDFLAIHRLYIEESWEAQEL